ncbi:alpha/beta hydrolase-fold protein [Bacillus sp. es.034]|uniref:alpha/beta hydrolase n=1 Tax=Bacillus sp. es.034 TaxID=1761763 RepID=UPI000BF28E8C|nr:alpha/beta hydrolase-fold protein [Bacillus sp. es.034]PFG06518.1 putative alpha/beta superfamily hydrolase [Bacillus sp. es.034]
MYDHFEVTITPLNRQRTVRVYLPENYHEMETKRYKVLYMHDGQNLYRDEDAGYGMAWRIGEYLEKEKMDLIVVGIDCNEGLKRLDEYGPWESAEMTDVFSADRTSIGGEGKKYIEFIVNELKPLIDRTYRTNPDETSMAGSSMGGLISTYAACMYPHIFKRVASISSAYWFNQLEIEDLIKESDLSPVERFYIDIGTKENTETIDDLTYIDSSMNVYRILKEKVQDSRFEIVEGAEHNEVAWRERVPMIFEYLFKI